VKRQHSLLEVLNVKLDYMPSCMRPKVILPLDQRILCSDCCKKCTVLCLAHVTVWYFVLHRSRYLLVLTTKVTHLCSLLFRQHDRVNSVVITVYSAITVDLFSTV